MSNPETDTTAAPPRDADHTLTYEGTCLQRRGLMLNLTDMWRAAGGPDHRRPADWLALDDTKRFRAHARWQVEVVDPFNAGPASPPNIVQDDIWRSEADGLVAAARGNGGGTWAHWQVALSYARYLSPAFHAWCNAVIRNAMERHGGPPRRRDGGMRYVEHQFGQLHRKLDRMDRHAADQMFLLVSTQELMLDKRRHFSERSRALMGAVISAEPYEGQCPCCDAAQVLSATGQPVEGAEYDHFFHRGLNRPEHGWLICKRCHVELTRAGYLARFGRMIEFRRFQSLVVDAHTRALRSRPATRP